MMRKILISTGYGSGWSTSNYGDASREAMLTYQPIIDAIEAGTFGDPETRATLEYQVKQDLDDPHCGGFDDMRIVEVDDTEPFTIIEYDGHESVIRASNLKTLAGD